MGWRVSEMGTLRKDGWLSGGAMRIELGRQDEKIGKSGGKCWVAVKN